MNEKFRKELDIQLSEVKWTNEDTEEVMKRMRPGRRQSVRMTVVLAAALAVLLALAGIGYAEYHSGILSALFGDGQIRKEAEELLYSDPVSLTKDGIEVTVTECLFDGQKLHMAAEMRNDTDQALLCGMKDLHGGEGNGVFGLISHLVLVQPGETAAGRVAIDVYEDLLEIQILAVALRPRGDVKPDVNDTELYSVYAHYGTELTETVFEETLSFPMITNQAARPSRTAPAVKEIRMEEYGFTVVMKKANFAAASSEVEFEIVPDDPKEILAYGDEGAGGHERLYRRYEILDENGERLFKGLTGGSGFGWNTRKTKLQYLFSYKPLPGVPENIVLVPCDDDGNYLMDEAVTVPIVPAK